MTPIPRPGPRAPSKRQIVVRVRGLEALRRMLRGVRFDMACGGPRRVGADGYEWTAVATDDLISRVRALGGDVRVEADLHADARARRSERSLALTRAATSRDAPRAGLSTTYRDSDALDAAIGHLVNSHAAATPVSTPHATAAGRRGRAIRIRAGAVGVRPTVLVTGGLHAREWVPPEACVSFATDLLEAYDAGAELRYGATRVAKERIRAIVETLEVVVFPNVNPDGRDHSLTHDAMWRKNRNPTTAPLGPACVGVDVNRNFPFLFDFERRFSPAANVATSNEPCDPSQTYCGASAASEPETRNVIALMDASAGLRAYVDVHAFGERILHPWGDDEVQGDDPAMNHANPAFDAMRGVGGEAAYREYLAPADRALLVATAEAMREAIAGVRGRRYLVQSAFAFYPTSGCSDDYATSRRLSRPELPSVSAFTVECGRAFQPTFAEGKKIVAEVSAALLTICLRTLGPT